MHMRVLNMALYPQLLNDLRIKLKTAKPLHSQIARIFTPNWQTLFYIGLFVAAVLTRFIGLGDRVMSHDESLIVVYGWNLSNTGEYQHSPLFHGPVTIFLTSLSFWLFGDNDFTARIAPASLGVFMVLMPKLLFERWLGKLGAMATSVMLLISPMILYYNRYNREDIPAVFFILLMVYGLLAYIDGKYSRQLRYLVLFTVALCLAIASKEVAFFHIPIFLGALVAVWLFQNNGWNLRRLRLIVAGIVIGTIGMLAMTCIMSIARPEKIWQWVGNGYVVLDPNALGRFLMWTIGTVIILLLVILLPALLRRDSRPQWSEIATVVIVALAVGIALTFGQDGSRQIPPQLSFDTYSAGKYANSLIISATWAVSLISSGIALVLRFTTSVFAHLRQNAVVDLLLVSGTLLLPWLTGLLLFIMGYELYAMPFHAEARESFLLLITPLILVGTTVGLCWRPQVWLICTVAFYGLCFVLYTTMFTNLDGIITGLGSTLGDLITQHSVRRGSQPQYYYLLTQLAVYEFLPCIGSLIAGLSGLWNLWHGHPIKKKSVERFPFIVFVALWAAFIHVAFTFYGQKQPWLTMYMTLPMIPPARRPCDAPDSRTARGSPLRAARPS
jgi:hypothetical protein